jgi:hypothetical protein
VTQKRKLQNGAAPERRRAGTALCGTTYTPRKGLFLCALHGKRRDKEQKLRRSGYFDLKKQDFENKRSFVQWKKQMKNCILVPTTFNKCVFIC